MSVDLRTSVIILESNDKKMQYYSKAIISLCHYWAIWYWFLNKLCHNLHFCLRLTFNTASRRNIQYHTDTRTRFTQPQTSAHALKSGVVEPWPRGFVIVSSTAAPGYGVPMWCLRGLYVALIALLPSPSSRWYKVQNLIATITCNERSLLQESWVSARSISEVVLWKWKKKEIQPGNCCE